MLGHSVTHIVSPPVALAGRAYLSGLSSVKTMLVPSLAVLRRVAGLSGWLQVQDKVVRLSTMRLGLRLEPTLSYWTSGSLSFFEGQKGKLERLCMYPLGRLHICLACSFSGYLRFIIVYMRVFHSFFYQHLGMFDFIQQCDQDICSLSCNCARYIFITLL